jgi:3-hydroxyphenylacetate 6-hydroxylase
MIDDKVFASPQEFRPERWIEQPDAPLFAFGTGARMCIGYQLAQRELYLLLKRVVACFTLKPVSEIEVKPVEGCADVENIVLLPKSYNIRFVPRNEEVLEAALNLREK